MRWKISHHGHDPRHIDLLAVLALLIVILVACHYLAQPETPSTASFIVPSQNVHW